MDLVKETGAQVTGANTYVTEEEADTFFEGEADATSWSASTSDAKVVALAQAARILERQFSWKGRRTTPESQPMQWPRDGVKESDRYVDTDEIPSAIPDAQCLIARAIIDNGGAFERGDQAGGMSGIKLGQGALELTYATDSTRTNSSDRTVVTSEVRAMLATYGSFLQGRGTVPVKRG